VNKTLNKFFIAIVLMAAQNVFAAANFSITPNGALPTTITPGQNIPAYYTLTNMTSTQRNGYVIQGLPIVVTQNSSAPNCSNPINLAPYASCQLQLDITGPVTSSFAICKGSSCTTVSVPLSVSVSSTPAPIVYKIPKFAYVTQYTNTTSVVVCTVDPVSGLFSNCVDAGGHSVLDNNHPQSIVVNSAGTTAYLTAYTDTPFAYQCTINPTNGTFTACTSTNITTPIGYTPEYGMLALNSANTMTYLADAESNTGRILACPINNNVISATCSDTGATGLSNGAPVGIVLNAAQTQAYLGDYDISFVTQCAVNGSTFSSCSNKTGDGTIVFGAPVGVALNNTGTILYVSDDTTKKIYGCNTSPNAGPLFSQCFIASNVPGATQTWGLTLNATSTFAYITDYSNTIYTCPILPNGTFSTCTANASYSSPVSVAFLY
jgi:hypothetical protein